MNNQIEFDFGEFLYLATDVDQLRRVCKEIQMRPHGNLYILSLEGQESLLAVSQG